MRVNLEANRFAGPGNTELAPTNPLYKAPGTLNALPFTTSASPAQVIRSLEVGENLTDGVRLIFLEESGFGLTMVGELGGPGVHTNLGYGPEPSREAMWDVMNSVVDKDSR